MAKFLVTYWKAPVGSGAESIWCGQFVCEAGDEPAAQKIADRAKPIFEEETREQAHNDWIFRACGRGGHEDGGDDDDDYPTAFDVEAHVHAISGLEWTEDKLRLELAKVRKARRDRGEE